jgi:hypothetical protein
MIICTNRKISCGRVKLSLSFIRNSTYRSIEARAINQDVYVLEEQEKILYIFKKQSQYLELYTINERILHDAVEYPKGL